LESQNHYYQQGNRAMDMAPMTLQLITLTADTIDSNNAFYGNLDHPLLEPKLTYRKVEDSNGYFEITISKISVNIYTLFSEIRESGMVDLSEQKLICFGGIKDYSQSQYGKPIELSVISR
jgi:hypothetical protein